MSRYSDLGDELNRILERRRDLCPNKKGMGMLPGRGHEEEWEQLTARAAEIRKEMRIVRYGIDTEE